MTRGQTVNLANTTTTITGSLPASTVVGEDYTVSVAVAPVAPGAGVPTGTVDVSDSAGNFCTVTSLTSGAGSCILPSTSSGTKTLTAHYEGDGSFNGSVAATASHVVGAADTTTSVSSSLNPSVFGQDVTFTATVQSIFPSTATPTGLVQFKIDGHDFGPAVDVIGRRRDRPHERSGRG